MKKNVTQHKIKNLSKSLDFVISNYAKYLDFETENIDLISEYSLHLFNLIESPNFVSKCLKPEKSKNQFINHINSEKFNTFPHLILEKNNFTYFFTQRDIIMFFRGINYHGEKNLDKKKKILNEFIQNSPNINMVFLVGVSFIETPVTQYAPKNKIGSSMNLNKNSTGVLDYGYSPLIQKINNKIFTKIEACWYKILIDLFNSEPINQIYISPGWYLNFDFNFSNKELEIIKKMEKTRMKKITPYNN